MEQRSTRGYASFVETMRTIILLAIFASALTGCASSVDDTSNDPDEEFVIAPDVANVQPRKGADVYTNTCQCNVWGEMWCYSASYGYWYRTGHC
jgi:hypothetical protein